MSQNLHLDIGIKHDITKDVLYYDNLLADTRGLRDKLTKMTRPRQYFDLDKLLTDTRGLRDKITKITRPRHHFDVCTILGETVNARVELFGDEFFFSAAPVAINDASPEEFSAATAPCSASEPLTLTSPMLLLLGGNPGRSRSPGKKTRTSSMGPFQIHYPDTEFIKATWKTYPSKSAAFGDLFGRYQDYSDYCLFQRETSTLYLKPKSYWPDPSDLGLGSGKYDCFYLPMEFGETSEMPTPLRNIAKAAGSCEATNASTQENKHENTAILAETSARVSSHNFSHKSHCSSNTMRRRKVPNMSPAKRARATAHLEVTKTCNDSVTPEVNLESPKPWHETSFEGPMPWREASIFKTPEVPTAVRGNPRTWQELTDIFIKKYSNTGLSARVRGEMAASEFLTTQDTIKSSPQIRAAFQHSAWCVDRMEREGVSFDTAEEVAIYENLRADVKALDERVKRTLETIRKEDERREQAAGIERPVSRASTEVDLHFGEALFRCASIDPPHNELSGFARSLPAGENTADALSEAGTSESDSNASLVWPSVEPLEELAARNSSLSTAQDSSETSAADTTGTQDSVRVPTKQPTTDFFASAIQVTKPKSICLPKAPLRSVSGVRVQSLVQKFSPPEAPAKVCVAGRGYILPYRPALRQGSGNVHTFKGLQAKRAVSQAETELNDDMGSPLQRCNSGNVHSPTAPMDEEERRLRDYMLYG
jgi:hypothetical protein